MYTRQERFRALALRVTGAMSFAAVLTVLNGCVVQERAYAPPPGDYAAPARESAPPPANDYPPPQGYSPPQDYAQNAPASEYGDSQADVRTTEAPPPLPDYEQPPCPEPGYLWTPGYWGYGGGGYYWVPGTWVMPPQVGVLWTPGYWGWGGGAFVFHAGYWGPHVGFYGGVNYGGGYTGEGYAGGRWERDRFRYNTAVNNVNTTVIHNTYNQTVINNVTVNKVSYNGGAGGLAAAPSNRDQQAAHERHIPPPALQMRHITEAGRNPELQAKFNQGRPPIAATPRPAAFTAPTVVRARGAAPETRPGNYRDPTPYRDTASLQSPPAAAGRVPSDAPQQPPRLRPEFAQPQQRPAPQGQQYAQPQQRPTPQGQQYAQPQQRPAPQGQQYAQPQQRPAPQAQYAQPQREQRPQPQNAQPPQRPQPQAPHAAPPAAHPQAPRDDGRREGNRENRTP